MGNMCGGEAMQSKVKTAPKPTNDQKLSSVPTDEVKVLLLGAGESGKSTIFKQIIIHDKGFTEAELKDFKAIVHANVFKSARALVEACNELDIAIEEGPNQERAQKIAAYDDEAVLDIKNVWNQELGREIGLLWKDPGIQKAYMRRNEFQLDDSTYHYMSDIERLAQPDYLPTHEDVLRSRLKTTGIIEVKCKIGDKNIKLVDVGGQRNERRKWINCFSDADALIFVVSLSEYDLKCYEDNETPRMQESLILFQETINSKFFYDTPIVLFLNKSDLFKEKIGRSHLNKVFDDYHGNMDFESAFGFIKQKYEDQNKNRERKVFAYATCAMDTNQLQQAFDAVKDTLIKRPRTSEKNN